METTDYAIFKTFCLDFGPVVNLVAGDIFCIASYVEAGIGIRSVGTDGSHQLVVFVRNGILGSFVRDTVYFCINSFTLKTVGSLTIDFKLCFDLVEQRFLNLVVLGTEVCGTFEHQVLKVVS